MLEMLLSEACGSASFISWVLWIANSASEDLGDIAGDFSRVLCRILKHIHKCFQICAYTIVSLRTCR